MTIYVFGNPDVPIDNASYKVVNQLNSFPGLEFVYVQPNEDLPFIDQQHVILLDTVTGIDQVTLIDQTHLDLLTVNRGVTAHDYDLGFQLKYLTKLGKLSRISIIGIPQNGNIDYDLIHSILRKLVEQDMQGS